MNTLLAILTILAMDSTGDQAGQQFTYETYEECMFAMGAAAHITAEHGTVEIQQPLTTSMDPAYTTTIHYTVGAERVFMECKFIPETTA